MTVERPSSPQVSPWEEAIKKIDDNEWLSSIEATVYLRLLTREGTPCVERLRNLVHQGRVPFYKPFGRLMFKRSELKRIIETSRKGGFKWR